MRPTNQELFGKAIKEIRTKTGLSQERFGDALLVTGAYISKLESGLKQPSLRLLKRMSEVFFKRFQIEVTIFDKQTQTRTWLEL